MEMDMQKLTTVRDELDENVSQLEFNFSIYLNNFP